MFKAYRRQFDLFDSEKYRIFLKSKLYELSPRYYVIVASKTIESIDGPMIALKINMELTDPAFEPIIEVLINDQYIYYYQDECWAVAVDKYSDLLMRISLPTDGKPILTHPGPSDLNLSLFPCNKVLIIHKIGHKDAIYDHRNPDFEA